MGYRLFRATYTSGGKTKASAKWYVEFRDHLQTVRRLAGFTSKTATDELGTIPIRPALAAELRDHLAGKMPAAPAFKTPKATTTLGKVFQRDIAAAGIAYRDGDGKVCDFHALRHTFITNLARSGVHPKTAQSLARHSTITLTMDRYTHTLIGEQADALKVLPDFGGTTANTSLKTGTDGRDAPNLLASCLAFSDAKLRTSVNAR